MKSLTHPSKSEPIKPIKPIYDNNGNVTELLDGKTGEIIGRYEYDPYGNTTKIEGKAAEQNKIRFSTKEYDETSGLYYYGYRHYDPKTGRWPSRDPIEEKGGVNLYGFVGNDAVNRKDVLGLSVSLTVWKIEEDFQTTSFSPVTHTYKTFFRNCSSTVQPTSTNYSRCWKCICDYTATQTSTFTQTTKYNTVLAMVSTSAYQQYLQQIGTVLGGVGLSNSYYSNALNLYNTASNFTTTANAVGVFNTGNPYVNVIHSGLSQLANTYQSAAQNAAVSAGQLTNAAVSQLALIQEPILRTTVPGPSISRSITHSTTATLFHHSQIQVYPGQCPPEILNNSY